MKGSLGHIPGQPRKHKKLKKKSTLKKFLILFQEKVFLIFSEMEPPWLKIKKFLVFFQKKVFLIFPEMELSSSKLKKLFIFQEGIFQAQKIKKFHSEKIFCTFLYFVKWNFLQSWPKYMRQTLVLV